MKLNKEDTDRLLEQITNSFDELKQLFIDKNKDYGCSIFTTEPLCSSLCPMTAIRVRMNDKINRLSTLFNSDEAFRVKESIEDTLNDLAVYSIILANLYKCDVARKEEYAKCRKWYTQHSDIPEFMSAEDIADKTKAEIASKLVYCHQMDAMMKGYTPKLAEELEDIKITDGVVEQ